MTPPQSTASVLQQQLQTLAARRKPIEAELEAIASELLSPGPEGQAAVGLTGNLIDKDGFPRPDIDIMRITTLRNRMAHLNTDLASVMKEIDSTLIQLHQAAGTPGPRLESSPRPASGPLVGAQRRAELKPFARVAEVFAGSPAAECGLKPDDRIVLFGPVDASRVLQDGFSCIATYVSPGVTLKITIDPASGKGRKTVFLAPAPWSGQGLLGCRLVQLAAP
jgi:hypothetical protein